jgi:hypothetical protein
MKQVGTRIERSVQSQASGLMLAEGARLNEALAHLAGSTFVRKGVYRFRSHELANQHLDDCLAQGMALRALAVMRAQPKLR